MSRDMRRETASTRRVVEDHARRLLLNLKAIHSVDTNNIPKAQLLEYYGAIVADLAQLEELMYQQHDVVPNHYATRLFSDLMLERNSQENATNSSGSDCLDHRVLVPVVHK